MKAEKNYNNINFKKAKEKVIEDLEISYLNLLASLQKEENIDEIQICLNQYQLSFVNAIQYLKEEEKLQYFMTLQKANGIINKLKFKTAKRLVTNNDINDENKNYLLQDIESSFIEVKKAILKNKSIFEINNLLQWYYFTIMNAKSSLTKEEYTKYLKQYHSLISKIKKLKKQTNVIPTYMVMGMPISRIRFPGHETENKDSLTKK